MEIEKRERVIPETREDYLVYIADDGTEFTNKEKCQKHENLLKLLSTPVIKNCVTNVETFDGYYATLYYIQNKEDYETVLSFVGTSYLSTDYPQEGPGWYIFHEDDGDIPFKYLYHYNNYVKVHMEDVQRIIDNNIKLVQKAEARMKE